MIYEDLTSRMFKKLVVYSWEKLMSKDTGDIAEVPVAEQLDLDIGEGSNALEEGTNDTEELNAIYDDPGEVIEENLG